MSYLIPDGWPLPHVIHWVRCAECGMIYGDGDFNQDMLDEYYVRYYGYDLCHPDNVERLKRDADMIAGQFEKDACIVDFGGGTDGESVLVNELVNLYGFWNSFCVGAKDVLPHGCDVIYASHVIEHIYDLPDTMRQLSAALKPDGLLIIDVPDATGLLRQWRMPIIDYNTKHINHFTLRNLLDLGYRHGFESVSVRPYISEGAPCVQVHFRRLDVADGSRRHIQAGMLERAEKLLAIDQPVNVWGLSDIAWHLLSIVHLDVLDYIDNDPAYRGQTYNGKPVRELPTNDAPIVIMAQRQRGRLVENIRAAGVQNVIITV